MVLLIPKKDGNIFPSEERTLGCLTLLRLLSFIWQTLVRKDGNRTPIREYLVLNEEVRDQLIDVSPDEMVTKLREIIPKYGQTAFMDAKIKYDQGLIDYRVFKKFNYG